MSNATVTGPLFDGGPTMLEVEDPESLWHVRVELRGDYLAAVAAFTRSRVREVESQVQAGLSGSKTISSSWLLGLRAEAREAAGLPAIALDRLGDYRVTDAWPPELSGFDAFVAWALHQSAVEAAADTVSTRAIQDAIGASTRSACPACGALSSVPGARLCALCEEVAEVLRFRRAEELGRERVEGRRTRAQLVEAWLDR